MTPEEPIKITTVKWEPKTFTAEELLQACEKARKEEREACAKVAETTFPIPDVTSSQVAFISDSAATTIAQAIRARTQTRSYNIDHPFEKKR